MGSAFGRRGCWKLFFVVVGLIFWGWVSAASGGVYFVAPDGNDSNPGTEPKPWQTITKAARTLTAGDTVYIRNGIYKEQVVPERSGAEGRYVTYRAYEGEEPVIDGSEINLPQGKRGLFYIKEKEFIRVIGLTIINAGPGEEAGGIMIRSSGNIIVSNNHTYNTVSSGIGVWSSWDVTVEGNEVELACNDGVQECITIADTVSFEVIDNHVHHSGPGTHGGEGIDVKQGSRFGKVMGNLVEHINRIGIYVDAWNKHTHNIGLYRNVVRYAQNGIAISSEAGGLLDEVEICNNLIYSNAEAGIWITPWGNSSPSHPMASVHVVNNTLHQNGLTWGGGILIDNPEIQRATVRNNICSSNLTFQIAVRPVLDSDRLIIEHNLINGFRGQDLGLFEVTGDSSQFGDPLFLNQEGGDFRLSELSPAIDAGTPAGAPVDDFEGLARPQGPAPDIGAFEFRSGEPEESAAPADVSKAG